MNKKETPGVQLNKWRPDVQNLQVETVISVANTCNSNDEIILLAFKN